MASKTIIALCTQALLVQVAFAISYNCPNSPYYGSVVNDNVVIDNDIFVNSGYGGAAYGYGAANAGNAYGVSIGNAGVSSSSAGLGIGSAGLGIGSAGLGIGSAGFGLGRVGLGSISAGSVGVGSIGLGGLTVASSPLVVTSISPIGPSGLAVASENVLEGNLLVTGQLPFLSAVAFDGALPTAGSGVATCGCGNGVVGIVSEGVARPNIYY